MSAHDMCIVLKEACLQKVSTLMVCCMMIHCCAPLGMAVPVKRGPRRGWILVGAVGHVARQGVVATSMGIGAITFVTGRRPGVLLRVTQRCRHSMVRKARLAVGLRVSMTVGASVILGIVIMGESSITLCSTSCASR
jgi:hypothetical protein